jgi:hypothetical protein
VTDADGYIVRFSDPYPAKDTEGFFFSVLLRKKPFRNETSLTLPGETYFKACVREGYFRDRESLNQIVQECWCDTHPLETSDAVCDKILDALGLDHDLSSIGGASFAASEAVAESLNRIALEGVANQIDAGLTVLRMQEEERRLRNVELATELAAELDALRASSALDASYVPLDPGQREFVLRVTAPDAKGLIWLDGGPGTGKSLATKCAIHILRQRGLAADRLSSSGMLITASSAKAARRLSKSAQTSHSAFNIPARGPLPEVNGAESWFQEALRSGVFILEEYSMCSAPHLITILQRLRTIFRVNTNEELFLKILFVLVGDRYQLPPVCRHRLTTTVDDNAPKVCDKCHLGFSEVFKTGTHYELTTVHRFAADKEWLDFLNIIRKRMPTEAEVERVLGPFFVSHEAAKLWVDSTTTVICSHHAERKTWSDYLYDTAVASNVAEASKLTPMEVTGPNTSNLSKWVNLPKFHLLERVSVGMRVVCRENISTQRGILNGSTGVVTQLRLNRASNVTGIEVRMDDTGELHWFSRTMKERTLDNSGLSPQWHEKRTFPLMCVAAAALLVP